MLFGERRGDGNGAQKGEKALPQRGAMRQRVSEKLYLLPATPSRRRSHNMKRAASPQTSRARLAAPALGLPAARGRQRPGSSRAVPQLSRHTLTRLFLRVTAVVHALTPLLHLCCTQVAGAGPSTGAKRDLPVSRPRGGHNTSLCSAARSNATGHPPGRALALRVVGNSVPATLSKALIRPCLAYPLASLDVSEQRPVYRAGASPNEGPFCGAHHITLVAVCQTDSLARPQPEAQPKERLHFMSEQHRLDRAPASCGHLRPARSLHTPSGPAGALSYAGSWAAGPSKPCCSYTARPPGPRTNSTNA